jgi:hypothetical protein
MDPETFVDDFGTLAPYSDAHGYVDGNCRILDGKMKVFRGFPQFEPAKRCKCPYLPVNAAQVDEWLPAL